ncbi:hypothetical protein EV363DRAFT_1299703 [Boletus edulis]|nr:hypothetical protein EV363DRAFT_1299703 [Boletus edulis]
MMKKERWIGFGDLQVTRESSQLGAHACKGVEGVMRIWGELECVPGVRMGPGLGLVGRGEMTRYTSEADSHERVVVVLLYMDGRVGMPIALRERGRIVEKDLDERVQVRSVAIGRYGTDDPFHSKAIPLPFLRPLAKVCPNYY